MVVMLLALFCSGLFFLFYLFLFVIEIVIILHCRIFLLFHHEILSSLSLLPRQLSYCMSPMLMQLSCYMPPMPCRPHLPLFFIQPLLLYYSLSSSRSSLSATINLMESRWCRNSSKGKGNGGCGVMIEG